MCEVGFGEYVIPDSCVCVALRRGRCRNMSPHLKPRPLHKSLLLERSFPHSFLGTWIFTMLPICLSNSISNELHQAKTDRLLLLMKLVSEFGQNKEGETGIQTFRDFMVGVSIAVISVGDHFPYMFLKTGKLGSLLTR